ncbi:hypothetical protein LTR37_005318 [Vermiconidia calcicola]|uniref:Uncharacterized protein n=1 Tax=Vermiconidia calcicola TaxID=1690605 RepID=A0ACC3NML2_9PEZI|nr:hypothetical protein LTR37_005318 [Vermiconidia calcicola]
MSTRVSYGSRAGSSNDYPNHLHSSFGAFHQSQGVRPPCASLEELTHALREDMDAGTLSSVPECTTSNLSLNLSALVPLLRPTIGPYSDGGEHDLPPEFKTSWTNPDDADEYLNLGLNKAHPLATIQSIASCNHDHQLRQTVQRAASRGIVAAVEALDGFKYSFNNGWSAKDEDGLRFSYICQDSMQNKDRHANGFPRTQKHLKGNDRAAGVYGPNSDRAARKPTYDCKGSVSVKCSFNRQSIDVYYRHYAIHPTVEERRTLPKAGPQVRQQRGQIELADGESPYGYDAASAGGLLGRLKAETAALNAAFKGRRAPKHTPAPTADGQQQHSNVGKPLKRKRDSDAPLQVSKSGKPLSLVELLRQSEAAKEPLPQQKSEKSNSRPSTQPPPVTYDLPSWQRPPPAPAPAPVKPPPPPPPPQQQFSGLPYQPPYNPMHASRQQQQYGAPARPNTQHPLAVVQRQEYLGLPKDPHPQAQGLFTTMKPVWQDTFVPRIYVPNAPSRRNKGPSCGNCRAGKKGCDEQKPVCGNCAKSGRVDCNYEAPSTAGGAAEAGPLQAVSAWNGQQTGEGLPLPATPQQQQPTREESPDPWFPKR